MKRYLAVMLFSLGVAACARAPSTASADSGAAAAQATAAQPTASAAPAASTPLSAGALTAAATTQQEGADSGATDSSAASLERIAALPPAGQLPAGKWIAGTHYTVLMPAQPTDAPPGKVQVVEVFWYGCPHCYAFDPYLQNWLQNKPSYVEFERIPVMWEDVHRAHARLFYTLQALGKLDALHTRVFDEIHQKGDPLYVPADPKATFDEQLQFAEANGISAADFTAAYNSLGVQSALQKADDLDRRYKIDKVPTIVIDGKYEADPGTAGGEEKLIELINDLAASEKQLRAG